MSETGSSKKTARAETVTDTGLSKESAYCGTAELTTPLWAPSGKDCALLSAKTGEAKTHGTQKFRSPR